MNELHAESRAAVFYFVGEAPIEKVSVAFPSPFGNDLELTERWAATLRREWAETWRTPLAEDGLVVEA